MAPPSVTARFRTPVTNSGGSGYYVGSSGFAESYIIQDFQDSGADDANVLGDISGDTFTVTNNSNTLTYTYVARALGERGGIIGRDGNNSTYLFSYYQYPRGGGPTTSSAPFNFSEGLESSTPPPPICYVTGSLIRTDHGDLAVETLRVGDRVLTLDGRLKPIRWIGRRRVRCKLHPTPTKVHPVRVTAGTFGEDLPYADLWLSPGHALCLDGSLVPVCTLIDGSRIVQVAQPEVTYWHVELDGHDVILANGLPAESYLDTGNRRSFDDVPASLLHFDEDPAPGYDGSGYCMPVVVSGPRLSAIRAQYGLGRVPASEGPPGDGAAHFVADGMVLAPCLLGENDLRVLVPAGVTELRLISPTFKSGPDVRRLGVIVNAISVSDGMSSRRIALDSVGLYAGFHDVERDGKRQWRWTDGEAHLAPSLLWPDLTGPVLLRLQGMFSLPATVEADEAGRLTA